MAAQKSVINSEAMARLRKDTKFAMSAKKAVNQFNNFSGPPGRYFARLQRLDFRFHKTEGHPCFTFYHTCLAACPDSGSDNNIVDQTHAGAAMKVFREVKVTEKMTKQDAWDAAMVDLQAYDIKTRNFGIRNGVEVQDDGATFWSDLGDALDALQERRPAVIIDVSAGKPQPGKAPRNFVNVRETVSEEIVSRFASPIMDISDEEMEVPDEDSDEEGPSVEEQIAMIMGLDRDKLIEALSSQGLVYPWENLELEHLQDIGCKFVQDQPLPEPALFDQQAVAGSVKTEQLTVTDKDVVSSTVSDDEEEGEVSDDEEDGPTQEEADAATLKNEEAGLLVRLQHTIANENRDQLKKRLRSMGALLPETPFKKDQTDEFLRDWIVKVYTGEVAPAMIVAPDEVVPF